MGLRRPSSAGVSRTKIGALLLGIGAIIGTVGGYLAGDVALAQAFSLIVSEVGAILLIFGIRGWPILNGGKK